LREFKRDENISFYRNCLDS